MKVSTGYEHSQEITGREPEVLGKQGSAKGHKQHENKGEETESREVQERRGRRESEEEKQQILFENVIMPSTDMLVNKPVGLMQSYSGTFREPATPIEREDTFCIQISEHLPRCLLCEPDWSEKIPMSVIRKLGKRGEEVFTAASCSNQTRKGKGGEIPCLKHMLYLYPGQI